MAKQGFTFKTKWTDRGWSALRARLTDGPPAIHAKVGVFGPDASKIHPLKDDLTVEEIALINEFGSKNGHVPQRSFLRRTFWWNNTNRRQVKHVMAKVSQMVIFQKVPRHIAMRKAGEWGVAEVKKTIMSGVGPANRPSTKEAKGHGQTLRHTMTLHDSISYVIIKGGAVVGGNTTAGGSGASFGGSSGESE